MLPDDKSKPTTVSAPADTPPVAPMTAPKSTQPKFDKKKLIIAASVLVALIAGGVASAMWWTGPQKSLDDALLSDFPRGGIVKGTMEVTPNASPAMTFDFDSKFSGITTNTAMGVNADLGMMKLKLDGGLATDANKNVYFRINNVRKTIESFAGDNAPLVEQQYGGLINKIDNKWVQMTESDLKDLTKDSGADMSCVVDKLSTMTRDKKYSDELKKVFSNNKYITIKDNVGSEKVDGKDSHHLVLNVDKNKMKSYGDAMKNTTFFKDVSSCFKNKEDALKSEDTTTGDVKYELWVDKWSHKINKIMMTTDTDGTAVKLTATMTYNDAQKVDTPKADTQFKDLKTEIESLQEQVSPALSEQELNAI